MDVEMAVITEILCEAGRRGADCISAQFVEFEADTPMPCFVSKMRFRTDGRGVAALYPANAISHQSAARLRLGGGMIAKACGSIASEALDAKGVCLACRLHPSSGTGGPLSSYACLVRSQRMVLPKCWRG
jgi:hypothetical protein